MTSADLIKLVPRKRSQWYGNIDLVNIVEIVISIPLV